MVELHEKVADVKACIRILTTATERECSVELQLELLREISQYLTEVSSLINTVNRLHEEELQLAVSKVPIIS